MDQRFGGLGRHLALAITGTLTLWVAVWSWSGFLEDPGSYLRPLFVLALAVAAAGAAGRWARLPGLLVVAGQSLLSVVLGTMLLTRSLLPPLAEGGGALEMFRAAIETAQTYAAPVPADAPGLHPLLVAGGLGLMLLVDVLAGTMRRASLAGLPLLAAIALPVSMLGGRISPLVFGLTAAGFLALLLLQEDDQVARWGRSLAEGGDTSSVLGRPGAARAGAAAIGTVVTALALVVPTGVPSLGLTLFDGPFGAGANDDIKLDNPMIDLRRDLKRGQDVPLVTVRTPDPDPRYLRITVLSRFSLTAWSSGDRDLPDDQRADGPVPGLDGIDRELLGETYPWRVEATEDFASEWLPTPYPVSRVDAPGNWKYDVATMDFLAARDDLDAAGLSYSTARTEVDVTADQLAAASQAALVDEEYTELPQDLPPLVTELADGLTADAGTTFERAQALQQWFRSDGGFEYTLERDDGNGGDALVEFLSQGPEGRRGYCEQFASAMAVMARSVGIPARVAIGFLRPDSIGPDVYQYSTHDLHSWPELYFAGAGWVRFEPTPAGRAPGVPSYTQGEVQLPDGLPGAEGGLGAEGLPDRGAAGDAGAAAEPEPEPEPTASSGGGGPWGLLTGGLVVLLLGGLALLPRWWRRRRAGHRWASAPPAVAAWAELRDASVDLGLAWPGGRSPRMTGAAMLPAMAAGPVAAEHALDRLVRAIEEQWYAPVPGEGAADALRRDVDRCVEAMTVGVPARRRWRARWLPASLVRTGAPGFAERSLADADRVG